MTIQKRTFVLLVICLLGGLRWFLATRAIALEPFWPDISGYIDSARQMTQPFATGAREPIWIWGVWVVICLLGENVWSFSLLGGLCLFASAYFYFRLIGELFNDFRLQAIALFLFLNSGLVLSTTVHATRDTLFLTSVLSLGYYIFGRTISDKQRLWGLSLSAIVLVGVRFTSLFPLFLILLAFKLLNKWRSQFLLLPVISAFLFNAPYFWYCYQTYGDPFYSSNLHAVWWHNYEFGQRGDYSGPALTWSHYIFAMHSLKEVLVETLRGFAQLLLIPGSLLRSMTGAVLFPFYLVYWLGLALLIKSSKRFVLILPLLLINVLSFMVHLNMDTRLYLPLLPFTTLAMAYGLVNIWDFFIKIRG